MGAFRVGDHHDDVGYIHVCVCNSCLRVYLGHVNLHMNLLYFGLGSPGQSPDFRLRRGKGGHPAAGNGPMLHDTGKH